MISVSFDTNLGVCSGVWPDSSPVGHFAKEPPASKTNFISNPSLPFSLYPVGENLLHNKMCAALLAAAIDETYPKNHLILVCMGSSGAIMASFISAQLRNVEQIVHIKKDGELSHNPGVGHIYEGSINIIVDDAVCSGRNVNLIVQKWKEYKTEKIHALAVCGPIQKTLVEKFEFENVICTSFY